MSLENRQRDDDNRRPRMVADSQRTSPHHSQRDASTLG